MKNAAGTHRIFHLRHGSVGPHNCSRHAHKWHVLDAGETEEARAIYSAKEKKDHQQRTSRPFR